MSDNKEFIEFYNQTRENHIRMHTWDIRGLSVWYVSGFGKREATTVLDCRDFGAITTKGCMIITKDHGVWLKINDQNWTEPATGVRIVWSTILTSSSSSLPRVIMVGISLRLSSHERQRVS